MIKISEITEVGRQVLESLFSNPLRSFLSSLGVIIGISFVITMGWLLDGMNNVLEDTINLIGEDMIYIEKFSWTGGHQWKLYEQRKDITYDQAMEFCRRIKVAQIAMPITRKGGAKLKYQSNTYNGFLTNGTKSEYGLTPAATMLDGRFFLPIEDLSSARVVVLAYNAYKTIFGETEAVGKTIKIQGYDFRIVGVIKKRGTAMMDFVDNQIFIPISVFNKMFDNSHRSFSIAIKAGNPKEMDEVREEAQGLMRIIRNIPPGKEDDFSLNETKTLESSIETFRLYVGGIGIGFTVLSFIVGIIGIVNIMFVSVTERTKEIGIRKAIGAKKISILLQFIIESTALCLVGAIVSYIVCSILFFVVASTLPGLVPSLGFLSKFIPVSFFFIASGLSIFVGIIAGFIPALRAANLDPVDALRYD
ncbi:MAG: ABC transporter permease [Candidatus Kapabacteria bacterium]|nr:ABC transporter permease [Candidatus Kapabacteria bacterium]